MSSLGARWRQVATFVLIDARMIGVLTVVYVSLGLVFVRTDYTLNDEGLLTYYWANWARQDFLPVFFCQKFKPVLCALYAPFSGWGIHATHSAHVVVAALSIPMIAATARSLGYRLVNLPAIVLAFSPIYFFGGSAGLSNTDGAVGVTLVFFLLTRGSPLLAGIATGVLPWVRFELALFALVVAGFALLSKPHRAALFGITIFPVLYAASGALYHADWLWMAHFPPSAAADPSNPIYWGQMIGLRYFLESALALTPAAAVVAALRVERLAPVEKVALLYALLALSAVTILPIFRIGNFGASPRYSIQVIAPLALLLARAVEPWWNGEPLKLSRLLAVLLLTLWMVTRQTDPRLIVPFLMLYGTIVAIAHFRPGTVAPMLVAILAAVGPLLPLRFEVGRTILAPYLDPMVEWLRSHPAEVTGPIYTNSQLLDPFLKARNQLPGADVYFMVGDSNMIREEMATTNPNNGQRDRLHHFAATDLYGKMIVGRLTPDDLPEGALLALRIEGRLPHMFPDEVWAPRLNVIAESPHFRIARLHGADTVH